MLVKAIKMGFYKMSRQRVGAVFEMAGVKVEKNQVVDKAGKPVSWVVAANGEGVKGPKVLGPNGGGQNPDQTTSESSSADPAGSDKQ